MSDQYGHVVPLYAVPIHDTIASGDLQKMKALAAQADRQLASQGDVGKALAALKAEIAKLEARR